MSMITNDWLDEIQGEFKKPYYKELYQFVRDEYSKTAVSYTHLTLPTNSLV